MEWGLGPAMHPFHVFLKNASSKIEPVASEAAAFRHCFRFFDSTAKEIYSLHILFIYIVFKVYQF